VDEWFNTACFTAPSGINKATGLQNNPWTFGDEPRVDATIRQQGVNNFDFALFKKTTLCEKMDVEFRAEFFNLFNHTRTAEFDRDQFDLRRSDQHRQPSTPRPVWLETCLLISPHSGPDSIPARPFSVPEMLRLPSPCHSWHTILGLQCGFSVRSVRQLATHPSGRSSDSRTVKWEALVSGESMRNALSVPRLSPGGHGIAALFNRRSGPGLAI
jgi:hypothetical protein